MIDVGLRECRQAAANCRRDQHIDLGEDLFRKRLQDRTAPVERLDVIRRRYGIAAIHAAADVNAILARPLAHPLRVDGRRFDPRDDAAIGRHRIHKWQHNRLHSCASFHQHRDRVFHRFQHGRIDIFEEPVGWQADTQPAQVAVERCFIIRYRLMRTGRVLRIAPGNQCQHTGTIPRRTRQWPDIVGAERQRHDAITRDARLRRLDPGHAARSRRQADRSAGIRSERHVIEARRHRHAGARRRSSGNVRQIPRIVAVAKRAVVTRWVLRKLRHVEATERVSACSAQSLHHRCSDGRPPILAQRRAARA